LFSQKLTIALVKDEETLQIGREWVNHVSGLENKLGAPQ
jgi:hypothetical protein